MEGEGDGDAEEEIQLILVKLQVRNLCIKLNPTSLEKLTHVIIIHVRA